MHSPRLTSISLAARLAAPLLALLAAGCGGGGGDSSTTTGCDYNEVVLVLCNGRDDTAVPAGTYYFPTVATSPIAFTLSGALRYEDRLYGLVTPPAVYGFTGVTEYKPVRFAIVDLVDENGTVLQTTTTDGLGYYTLSATAKGLLHVRVIARTERGSGISVKNNSGETYAVSRYFMVPAEATFALPDTSIPIGSMAGAFNILDVYTAAIDFVQAVSGAYPARSLTAYWQPGSTAGTYSQSYAIYVLGGDGDTDEYDDDVLLHEFGHFVEMVTGNLDSPGGSHTLGDNQQDMRLAWSEGWASFTAGAIKKWMYTNSPGVLSDPTATDPSYASMYIDTSDAKTLKWNFDANYAPDSTSIYASCETAVAKVLWSLDHSFDYQRIWGAYGAFPSKSSRSRPVSLETFWDTWQTTNPGSDASAAFAERKVTYAVDGSEALDNEPNNGSYMHAAIEHPFEHTLFRTGAVAADDRDFFLLDIHDAGQYTVETFGLINGADTLLRVYATAADALGDNPASICGSSGTATCSNDNYKTITGDSILNNGCTLASRLTFTAATTGTYYLRVSSAISPSVAAGRYGAYRVALSQAPAAHQCP